VLGRGLHRHSKEWYAKRREVFIRILEGTLVAAGTEVCWWATRGWESSLRPARQRYHWHQPAGWRWKEQRCFRAIWQGEPCLRNHRRHSIPIAAGGPSSGDAPPSTHTDTQAISTSTPPAGQRREPRMQEQGGGEEGHERRPEMEEGREDVICEVIDLYYGIEVPQVPSASDDSMFFPGSTTAAAAASWVLSIIRNLWYRRVCCSLSWRLDASIASRPWRVALLYVVSVLGRWDTPEKGFQQCSNWAVSAFLRRVRAAPNGAPLCSCLASLFLSHVNFNLQPRHSKSCSEISPTFSNSQVHVIMRAACL